MFTADTREQLLKEVLRREVREEVGCDLEDLLNPIKVRKYIRNELHSKKDMAIHSSLHH
jgi:hypothetical protein